MAVAKTSAGVELLASTRHTAGALLLLLTIGIAGRVLVTERPAATLEQFGNPGIYLAGLVTEWLLFAYVFFGVRRGAKTVRQVIDASRWSLSRLALYGAIAVGAALVWMVCASLLGRVLPPGPDVVRFLQILLPHNPLEKAIWIILSLSAGFCEEFVYRGYLQQQFQRLSGSLPAAVVLQAAAFGMGHVALPWKILPPVMCLALLLGGLAAWRQSLVPGMLLHAGFDILAGLLSPP